MGIYENCENIVFASQNIPVDDWTITASSSAANFPATEIQNPARTLTWRSTAAGTQWLDGATLVNPVTLRQFPIVVVCNHNFDTNTTIQLQIWNATILFVDITVDAINYKNLSASNITLIDEIRPYKNRVIYPPASLVGQTIVRWRLTFQGTSEPYYEVGRVFVTDGFQPTANFASDGIEWLPNDQTRFSQSEGGQQFSDIAPARRGVQIKMPDVVSENDLAEFMRLFSIYGKRRPIFIDPFPRTDNSNYGVGDTNEALFNLLWQMYGTQFSENRVRRLNAKQAAIPGAITVLESL